MRKIRLKKISLLAQGHTAAKPPLGSRSVGICMTMRQDEKVKGVAITQQNPAKRKEH